MEDFFIKFQGLHPSEFTRSYLTDKLSSLREEAPYGANIQAVFSRQDHLFKGRISIHSSAGKFFATASDSKLKDVTQKLIEQIRKQLGRWKERRFRTSSLKRYPFYKDTKETPHDTQGVA